MTFKRTFGLCALISSLAAVSATVAAASAPSYVLVIPARQRMVKLAFEVARLKDVCVVSYSQGITKQGTLLHVWDGRNWNALEAAAYADGSFVTGQPKALILVGDSSTLPAELSGEPAWCKKVHKLATLDTAALVNEFGRILAFNPKEWRWIAHQEGLRLSDENAERRRYGRWGAPGKEQEQKMPPPVETTAMPPAAPAAQPVVDMKANPSETAMPKVEIKAELPPVAPPIPPEITPPKSPGPDPRNK